MVELNNLNGTINTYSGKVLDLFNPTPEMIDIRDIARGLAFKGHFAGQTPHYFSIAQHCIVVTQLIRERDNFNMPTRIVALAGLLHDAAESYIGDMIKPIKVHLPTFEAIEDKLLKVIFTKYGLGSDYDDLMRMIKPIDNLSQRLEFESFYKGRQHVYTYSMTPEQAYTHFTRLFYELSTTK